MNEVSNPNGMDSQFEEEKAAITKKRDRIHTVDVKFIENDVISDDSNENYYTHKQLMALSSTELLKI